MFLAWYNGGEFGVRWWINRGCEEGLNLMMNKRSRTVGMGERSVPKVSSK